MSDSYHVATYSGQLLVLKAQVIWNHKKWSENFEIQFFEQSFITKIAKG